MTSAPLFDTEEKFQKFSKKLLDELIRINSCFLLYKHLLSKHNDRLDAMNCAPVFFTHAEDALFTESLIGLARLYEPNDRKSFGNLSVYLRFIEDNIPMFDIGHKLRRNKNEAFEDEIRRKYKNESREIVLKHKKLLVENKSKIDTLLHWRDNSYAHNDRKYFLTPEVLSEKEPLYYNDMQFLIDTATDIINEHTARFNGVVTSTKYPTPTDVDTILDIVHNYRINRLKKYKNDIGN